MRVFRACILCLVGAGIVSVYCLCLGAAESQPPAAQSPNLLQRVSVLEAKVAQLEKKLAEQPPPAYPIVPPGAMVAPGLTPAQPAPQSPPGVPRNAVPHTYNGQSFYIVPLGKDAVP
jgi:hypothetical protein